MEKHSPNRSRRFSCSIEVNIHNCDVPLFRKNTHFCDHIYYKLQNIKIHCSSFFTALHSLGLFLTINIIFQIKILGKSPFAKFLLKIMNEIILNNVFCTWKRIIPPSLVSMLSNSASMSSNSSPVHFSIIGLRRVTVSVSY